MDPLRAFIDDGGLDRVLRPLHRPCRWVVDYADFRQEVLLRAMDRIASLRGRTPQEVGAWIKTIGRRRMVDYLRQSSREGPGGAGFLPDREPAADGDGEAEVLRREAELRWLAGVVEALPPEERELLDRRYRLGQSWEEISIALNISPNTLSQRHLRLIKRIRGAREREDPA